MVLLASAGFPELRARRVELSPLEGALLRDMVSPGLEHYLCYCNKLPLWSIRLIRISSCMHRIQTIRTETGQRILVLSRLAFYSRG